MCTNEIPISIYLFLMIAQNGPQRTLEPKTDFPRFTNKCLEIPLAAWVLVAAPLIPDVALVEFPPQNEDWKHFLSMDMKFVMGGATLHDRAPLPPKKTENINGIHG